MNSLDNTPMMTRLEQVYLIERDCGVLCRILGLYASRGVDVLHVGYEYAAKDVMKLQVRVDGSLVDTADAMRVLVDKASTFVGVMAACEHVGGSVQGWAPHAAHHGAQMMQATELASINSQPMHSVR